MDFLYKYRKRKLTDHWRNFIRPLMWRLKWTELRLKQLESQELKYSRELEEYDRGKHTAPDHFNLEEFGSKSIPFSSHRYRSKAKMRRKRKKIEATTDIASYTARHYLFSYLGTNFFAFIYLHTCFAHHFLIVYEPLFLPHRSM
jgi:hypothetical protein